MAEIGTRAIFENFLYTFGGKAYQQSCGGPIGARVTMCAARLVMQDWGERYRQILESSSLKLFLLKGYVDDVRQSTTRLPLGSRYDDVKGKFEVTEKAKLEDIELAETDLARMSRICLEAMNAINEDLKFTTETSEDFKSGRIPTLDTEWEVTNGKIVHSFYEKEMRTPYQVMARSAMSKQSKMAILSNELIRRLNTISEEIGDSESCRKLYHATENIRIF